MAFLCTCGGDFKSYKRGELIIRNGGLYSVDSFRCNKCEKTILGGIASSPMVAADSERAGEIIEAMAARGFNCYGGEK